jgi:hypothetical protein
MVNKMYDFISQRVAELDGRLQVIVVDHADLKDENFQSSIIEDWWKEINLVPEEWYRTD